AGPARGVAVEALPALLPIWTSPAQPAAACQPFRPKVPRRRTPQLFLQAERSIAQVIPPDSGTCLQPRLHKLLRPDRTGLPEWKGKKSASFFLRSALGQGWPTDHTHVAAFCSAASSSATRVGRLGRRLNGAAAAALKGGGQPVALGETSAPHAVLPRERPMDRMFERALLLRSPLGGAPCGLRGWAG